MSIPKILKNFNLFVQDKGYAGLVEELTLPTLSIKMEEYRAGGMDIPIDLDLGMEKMTCELNISEYDPAVLKLFGLYSAEPVKLVLRGGLSDETNTITPVVVTLEGIWQQIDMGSWKPGEKTMLKATVSLRYYELTINKEPMIKIDSLNMERIIGGEDQLADLRDAIGI